MQELALHIEYLLKSHDCVIVPGFGAFLASRRPAVYSPERIVPSSVEVFFNPAVCNDDGLLASSFARRSRLPFEEARLRLAEETESLRSVISSFGEATIGRVGVLRSGEEGTMTFHPRNAGHIAESLGMPVISLDRLGGDMAVTGKKETDGDSLNRKFNPDRNYYIAVNKIFARTAACFAAVAAVALSLWFGSQTIQNEQQYASVVPVSVCENPRRTVRVDKRPTTAVAEPEAAVKADSSSTANTDRYFLIVATFRTQSEADKFMTQRNDTRLHSVASGKMVRVAAASSPTRDDLKALMRSDRFKADYADSWIWESPE